jgi:predicted ArsR family transcriptional regulator
MSQQAAILSAMQSGANSSDGVARRTRIARHTVQVRLAELARLGVLQAYAMRTDGRRGRMPKFYRIATSPQSAAGTTG